MPRVGEEQCGSTSVVWFEGGAKSNAILAKQAYTCCLFAYLHFVFVVLFGASLWGFDSALCMHC